ncbi:MAG: retention module-containing protein, partial [Gallionellaceae bacterium]|nr:retention module-containing protein [Gallionellaceae bacterium]
MAATLSTQVIAQVVSVKGEAYAKGADGSMRQLHAGDQVYVGETLVTPQGAEIVVAFLDGHQATILPGESFYMAPEVAHDFQPNLNQAAIGTAEIDKVIQAINQGGDLNNMLEETAAGIAAGVGGENGGNTFVRLLRIAEDVTPLEYQFTPPTEAVINEPLGAAVVPADQPPPVPTDTQGSANEAGLADGSLAGDGSNVVNGVLNLLPGETTAAQSGTTSLGTWTVHADGTYTYVLTSATTDIPDVAETDSFGYTARDANGNTVTNTVTINIVDDVPVAVADTDSVAAGQFTAEQGNVVTGAGTTSGLAGA